MISTAPFIAHNYHTFNVYCSQMNVRGAPLIAIVAVLGLSVHLGTIRKDFNSVRELAAFLSDKIAYIRTSRPTAVNLFTATDDLRYLKLYRIFNSNFMRQTVVFSNQLTR